MMTNSHALDLDKILSQKEDFRNADPFPFLVMDDFLEADLATQLASEFPGINDERLFVYNNPLEIKMALNDYNAYPPATYQFLQYLNSQPVIDTLSELAGVQLYPDHGLHGGGWHIHGNGGKLNPHLDYSIHPKLKLQRKLNLIIYLAEGWEADWGGHLGFWSHNKETNAPAELKQETAVRFNRAVLFDTTQNSWHGITRQVQSEGGKTRNSIAIYYLAVPTEEAPARSRALYAPTEEQKGDEDILELIRKRVDLQTSKTVYKEK